MSNKKTIVAIIDFIAAAEKSIKNAKKLLNDLITENNISLDTEISLDTSGLNSYSSENNKVIEGVFTGNEMLGVDGNKYPIPVNYASKSKLVQGDKLKLIIETNGRMIYKQIKPIEREYKTGLVVKEKEKYQVISDGNTYDLLTASVTHSRINIGDKIAIVIPKDRPATFAAVDTVLPSESEVEVLKASA